ncbi:hypothetical protein SPRG_12959 [Saprolegnia parasitica CBS 223.65]|uniref:Uncharacterized protein n=1 Tax=Saprolegnia parasitica (strain CBS 223.65) TaxID=695850 RepID=A0A067BQS0_SAPPC|nr:hypothetical protein SPRG_12959 [Saprolegnia parasitica CBS 223.65]KDO20603.1 hypothetical protein SPRG_12959 [Saprolegnia parasitica CBS 223.65]|eukprot:XP_012208659.1 hypothetical protein SPRG_12959 [Saprolegnia parasitica CBS 223.65]
MCNRSLPMPGTPFGWTETSLLADPTARKLGLDWFSQHLYHNTERMLACAQIPSAGTFVDSIFLEVGDGFCDIIARLQIEYELPLHEAHAALRPHMWSKFRGDMAPFFSEFLDHEMTTAIAPEHMLYRRCVFDENESMYSVCREFASEDRVVFLMGTYSHDERLPHCNRSRPRLFWFILERTGQNTSRLRAMLYNAPYQLSGRRQPMREFLTMAFAIETSGIEDDALFSIYQDAVRKEIAPKLREEMALFRIEAASRDSLSTR